MTLTVEFEIHQEGHCSDCGSLSEGVCRAFGGLGTKECDAYRKRESRKRHCRACSIDNCPHPNFDGVDKNGPYHFDCADFTAPPRPEPSQC